MKIDKGDIMNDFIEPNRRQYSIPVYQRNYEWSKDQCEQLFEDILTAHRNDRYHFMGSIIYAPLKTENKIEHFVIIDGQQRLTTVYILLKALIDSAETEGERSSLSSFIFNEDKFKQYGINESAKLKLKPVKSDNQQLALLMDDHIDEMNTESGIYQNYIFFTELIRKEMDEDDSTGVEAIYDGMENLTCASIKLDEEDNPQEIFERLNSTGIPLNLSDKIRNFVLMVDSDQDKLYEEYWLPAENAVSKEKMSDFFLDFLNMKTDGFVKENNAYETFKKVYAAGHYTNESMLKEILHYALFYKVFLYGNDSYSSKVNECLEDLRKLKQSTVFLFLFHVFDDYDNNVINEQELEKVLEFLRNYSIRRMICEVSSNSLRGLYKTLYSRVFNRKENKEHYYDSIVSFFMQMTSKDVLPSDKQFSTALVENNLYRKNALCKYLLAAVENQGKEKLEIRNLSIEHVIPQNSSLSTAWKNMLGGDWMNVRSKYLHTLGNLTLTGYNSELGDKPFEEKKRLLADANSKIVVLNQDIMNSDTWNETAILKRADRLSQIIIKLFPVVAPSIEVSFSDPEYQEYSCYDPDTATFKTPNYFILQGEHVSCYSFAEMLKSVVIRLYNLDDTIIKDMARENKHTDENSHTKLFSYDKTQVNGNYQIPNTVIYENRGFSANHIISIIRELLDKYDIDHSDFAYSARAAKPPGQ